jgi:thiol-disulfide isomerase/thioredoxin
MRSAGIAIVTLLYALGIPAQVLAAPYGVGDRPAEIIGREIWSDKVISTEDYLGKWLLIDFFATWCGPCVAELPNLVNETKDLRGDRFEVLAVSVDFAETHDRLKPMLREHGATYPCIYQGGGWQTPPVKEWGVNGIPAIYLLNPQGVIVATGLRGELLRPALNYFLNTTIDIPPISLAATAGETIPGEPLAIHFDVLNPTRDALSLRVHAVQYIPEFADSDPEKQGRPTNWRKVSVSGEDDPLEYSVDCSDWGHGSHYLLLDWDPEAYYLSLDFSVRMPHSVGDAEPDGVWIGGGEFVQLPALTAARERQKAE